MRAFDLPGRSPVYASNAMVATSHPLANSTAIRVLQEGGNAIDAAIAANAVLGVVEPQMTGIGGDCFCIVAEPDGTLHGLNGSGRSPANTHLSWYMDQGISSIADHPAHAVTVPGSVNAWEMLLARFGTMGFDLLFRDAIDYAENGFPVAPRVAFDWQGAAEKLMSNQGASRHLLKGGQPPRVGDVFRFPALAKTMKDIAAHGASAFYEGKIAREISTTVQNLGGFLTEEDLYNAKSDWVQPISTHYNGHELFEIPPNGQGITALVLTNLLRTLNAGKLGADSVERLHMEVECARLAYSVRDTYVSDQESMTASINAILSEEYTNTLASRFHSDKRNPDVKLPILPDSDTVYLSVVDKDQRAVSFINSVYMDFGSGIVTPDSGIVLQNRGASFVVEPGHPNAIGPGKRPMHTIIPAMVMRKNRVEYAFGVMGGSYQPMGHAHVLSNLVDYAMDPQEALDHHRVFWEKDSETLKLESGAPGGMRSALEKLGHTVSKTHSPHGGGQIIRIDHEKGVLIGGSDPRKDGQAQGF